jgi:hypothetical protein
MLGGMFVLRRIAATHMPANLAEPQVHPGITHFYALLAGVRFWFQVANLIRVRATLGHGFSWMFY